MKDEKIKRIDIVFENCEVVELKPNMFTGFICDEVIKSYWINCFQYIDGEVNTFLKCRHFAITINKKGLKAITNCGAVLKGRLDHKDITHIDIIFKRRTEYISVPWEGTDYTNDLQKHSIDRYGLTIEIKEEK